MNRTKKTIFILALAAASIAMAASDGISLRKTLKAGTEGYHITSNSKMTVQAPTGEMDMQVDSKTGLSLKFGTVDATGASAPVDLTTKVEKFDVSGSIGDMLGDNKDKFLKTVTTSGTLDNRNRFTPTAKNKIDPMSVLNGSVNSSVAGIFVEFPDKAVNIGDTWDVTVPKGPVTGKEDQKLTAKLVEEKVVDGNPVYVISLTGTLKSDIDVSEIAKNSGSDDLGPIGQLGLTITGTVDFKSEAIVDKASGQTLSMDTKLITKQQMAFGGNSFASEGTSTLKMTLDK